MPERVRRRRSARKKTTRLIVAGIVLCSAMGCVAPVLYASDCSRWIAEYKQGILQKKAERRLRAAKYRLTTFVRPHPPVHHRPMRRPMGPLEALRRFQIDCGDVETPDSTPKLPTIEALTPPLLVDFPEVPPPDLPFPAVTEVGEIMPPTVPDTFPPNVAQVFPPEVPFPYVPTGFPPYVPPLANIPGETAPVGQVPTPGPVPEPGSWVLVLTGAGLMTVLIRRRAVDMF